LDTIKEYNGDDILNIIKHLRIVAQNTDIKTINSESVATAIKNLNRSKELLKEYDSNKSDKSKMKSNIRACIKEAEKLYDDSICFYLIDKAKQRLAMDDEQKSRSDSTVVDMTDNISVKDIILDLTTYLKKAANYQYEFYKLSENIDNKVYLLYKALAESDNILSDYINYLLISDHAVFTFKYNMFEPQELTDHKIDEFANNMKLFVKAFRNVILKNTPLAKCFDYYRDEVGRKVKTNIDELYTRWDTYIEAYRLYKEGNSFDEIFDLLGVKQHVESKYHTVNSYIDYANKYIISTEEGRFPNI
jgi:hypothetical protein